ncbi:MAG: hypothetical protein N2663_02340 [Chlorobi bacterium]|nr:hypothetical protein [Chlorobiota bacterium]
MIRIAPLRIAIVLLCLLTVESSTQILRQPRFAGRVPTAAELLNNGSQGREFVFCFPLNDSPIQPITAREIYVTSSRNTRFKYEIPGLGFQKVFTVQAMRVTVLTLRDVPMPEAEDSETPLDMAARITADDPVSVYVYNGKSVSSDGYLAIPVQSWGKEYIHLGWPDFREFRNWKGGFAIVAAYPDTRVTFQLRKPNIGDYGVTSARTEKGRRYGAVWTVTLQPGQCYLVQGDGTTRGEFDLSGSIVQATKPIGFISYHQRTMVPCFDIFNGRDHMIEMIPPTSMWGRNYVSVEYEREGYGDFFRVVALQDGTNIVCTSYDFKTKQKLEEVIMAGLRRGETRSVPDAGLVVTGPKQATGIRGMSVWRSNKPFFLMQYSASAEWDNASLFDPFMIYIVPVEQYTKSTIFQSPSNPAYSRHRFNLLVSANINDPEQNDIRSIKLDGRPITTLAPDILGNRIPGTNIHYARLFVTNGPHLIEGDAPFGAYIYGWGSFDSYGWPAATAYRKLDEFDSIPPPLSRSSECGDYLYTATETGQDFRINDTLNHIGTGINAIDFVEGKSSFNYAIEILEADGNPVVNNLLPHDQKNSIVKFRLRVLNKTQDAQAYFYVADRALNFSYDSVFWTAPKIAISPNPIDAGSVRVGRSREVIATITNNADSTFLITDLRMKNGVVFQIIEPSVPTGGLALMPRQRIQVRLRYTPRTEHIRANERDEDSLLIIEQCTPIAVLVFGRGVQPRIVVDDWDAGTISAGQTRCHTQQLSRGLRIRNPGTDTLTITSIDRSTIVPPFSLTDPTTPPLPIVIPPGSEISIAELCFSPTREDTFSITVRFESDASGEGNKPWSVWRGQSISPGPIVIGNNWGRVRIGTTRTLDGIIRNDGRDQVECTAVYLPAGEQHYRIVGQDRNTPFTVFPNGQDVVRVRIACTPQAEFDLPSRLHGDFTGAGTRSDALTAFGYLEKIEATGAIFRTPILVGTSVQSQTGNVEQFVTIANTSQSADLMVYSVEILPIRDPLQNLYPEDFRLLNILTDTAIPIGAAPELLAAEFRPSGAGQRKALVRIVHNAEPPVPDPTGRAETIVEIVGYAYTVHEPVLTGHDFGSVTTCDQPIGTATVTNTAPAGTPSSDVEVIGADLFGPDAGYFALISSPDPTTPLIVPAGQSRSIQVRFSPDMPRGYRAFIRVFYRGGDIDTAELTGAAYVIPVEIHTSFDTPIFNFRTGTETTARLSTRSLNWGAAQIYGFELRIRYLAKQLLYVPNSIERLNGLDQSWQFTAQETVEPASGIAELLIRARGQSPLATNADIAQIRYTVLLSDMPEQRFAKTELVGLIPYGSDSAQRRCVIPTLLPDSILPTTCFIDGRFIKISSATFTIMDVNPHPASGDAVTIFFSVGFDAPTSIRLYDARGTLIRTLVDGMLPSGSYELELPIIALSSGMYFIRYESAHVRYTRQLLIVR